MSEKPNVIEALSAVMARVEVTPDGCWIWQGAISSNGYGQIWVDGRQCGVHRYAFEAANGSIIGSLVIDHLCRRRACCNPGHLEAVPQRTNIARGENPVATFMAATACSRGHAFDSSNTYLRRDGKRNCRVCVRDNMRAHRARKKAS